MMTKMIDKAMMGAMGKITSPSVKMMMTVITALITRSQKTHLLTRMY